MANRVRTALVERRVAPLQLIVRDGGIYKRTMRARIRTGFVEVEIDKNAAKDQVRNQHAFPIAAHEFGLIT